MRLQYVMFTYDAARTDTLSVDRARASQPVLAIHECKDQPNSHEFGCKGTSRRCGPRAEKPVIRHVARALAHKPAASGRSASSPGEGTPPWSGAIRAAAGLPRATPTMPAVVRPRRPAASPAELRAQAELRLAEARIAELEAMVLALQARIRERELTDALGGELLPPIDPDWISLN